MRKENYRWFFFCVWQIRFDNISLKVNKVCFLGVLSESKIGAHEELQLTLHILLLKRIQSASAGNTLKNKWKSRVCACPLRSRGISQGRPVLTTLVRAACVKTLKGLQGRIPFIIFKSKPLIQTSVTHEGDTACELYFTFIVFYAHILSCRDMTKSLTVCRIHAHSNSQCLIQFTKFFPRLRPILFICLLQWVCAKYESKRGGIYRWPHGFSVGLMMV